MLQGQKIQGQGTALSKVKAKALDAKVKSKNFVLKAKSKVKA